MEPFSAPRPELSSAEEEESFACEVERLYVDLAGYTRSLLLHADMAKDVVQDTLVFLWERKKSIPLERVRATAFRVARFKCLAVRRDSRREKLVYFSDDALQRVAEAAEEIAGETETRLQILRECLAKLAPEERRLLDIRYRRGANLAGMAREGGVSPNRLQKAVSRLRVVLRHCVETSLSRLS